jgi:hypothetical protein
VGGKCGNYIRTSAQWQLMRRNNVRFKHQRLHSWFTTFVRLFSREYPTHDDVTLNVTSKKRISELMCLREQTNAAHK